MKLTSNDETLAESKVLILYILSNLNKAITNTSLYKIVLSVMDMNYFYYQQFLLDLVKSEFVINYSTEGNSMYIITEKGVRTLELTEDILPGIIKLQVDTNLKYSLENDDEENSIIAEYTPVNENYYNVTCKIMENNQSLFEIKTFAGSREQAKHIVENWKKYAGTIYPNLLEILTQDFPENNSVESNNYKNKTDILGSPLDVYNYDVINRNHNEQETTTNSEKNTEKSTSSVGSDVLEGQLTL